MMLCLSRKVGEDTVLRMSDGREIVIRVLEVGRDGMTFRNKIKLGIEAPNDITIFREEIRHQFEAIERGKETS